MTEQTIEQRVQFLENALMQLAKSVGVLVDDLNQRQEAEAYRRAELDSGTWGTTEGDQ